jgi:hypothetical protein
MPLTFLALRSRDSTASSIILEEVEFFEPFEANDVVDASVQVSWGGVSPSGEGRQVNVEI